MDTRQVVELLRQYSYPASSERQMHEGVAQILRENGIPFEREKRLTPEDRIEFYLPDQQMGIECKIEGGSHAVLRQLMRYAKCDIVRELVLLTSRMKHRRVPATLPGKPLHLVYGGRL